MRAYTLDSNLFYSLYRASFVFILVGCIMWSAAPAHAGEPVEIPLNFGLGPAAFMFTGPIQEDQLLHYGLQLDVAAIIDRATIQKHKNRVPKRYRKLAGKVGEARISHLLVPDSFIISPRIENTMIYGVSWRPIGLSISLMDKPVRLSVGAGAMLTYAYINTEKKNSETELPDKLPEGTTHFFRPGLDGRAILEIPFSSTFLMSFGWSSAVYVPQKLGTFKKIEPLDETVFHVGQGFVVLHLRFPIEREL